MKITYQLLFLVIAPGIFFSCNSPAIKASSLHVKGHIPIEFDNLKEFSVSFTEPKVIPLQTKAGSYIQEMSKILSVGDTLIIVDFKQSKIFLFDSKGNFISSMSNLGKGPAEYIQISDLTFDPVKKQFLLLDIAGRKVLRYDRNLKFISFRFLDVETCGYKFAVVGGNYLYNRLCNRIGQNDHFNIILTDTVSQAIKSVASSIPPAFTERQGSYNSMDIEKNKGYIISLYNDTLYKVENNKIIPFLRIDIPKKYDIKKTKSWLEGESFMESNMIMDILTGNKLYGFDNLIVNDDQIFLRFNLKGVNYMLVVNVKTQNSSIVSNLKFFDGEIIVEPIGKIGDEIIFKSTNTDVINILNRKKGLNLAEDNNPILFISKLR